MKIGSGIVISNQATSIRLNNPKISKTNKEKSNYARILLVSVVIGFAELANGPNKNNSFYCELEQYRIRSCRQVKKKPASQEAGFQHTKIEMLYWLNVGASMMFAKSCTSWMLTVCWPVVGLTS